MGVGMWDPGDDTKYSLHKPLAADDDTPKYSPDPKASAATAKGSFPTAYWNADFLALLTVAEFTRDAVDWRQMSLPFPRMMPKLVASWIIFSILPKATAAGSG